MALHRIVPKDGFYDKPNAEPMESPTLGVTAL